MGWSDCYNKWLILQNRPQPKRFTNKSISHQENIYKYEGGGTYVSETDENLMKLLVSIKQR